MVAGLLDRRYDLALISLPYPSSELTILPVFEEEMLVLRPSRNPVNRRQVTAVAPAELEAEPFLLYPKRSNMRTMIDGFFRDLGISPRVIMEADDTEAIKRLVEAGFGCSVLPEFALRTGPRYFRTFRVPERRLARQQVLAMAHSEYPRALTNAIAGFLRDALRRQMGVR